MQEALAALAALAVRSQRVMEEALSSSRLLLLTLAARSQQQAAQGPVEDVQV